MSVRASERRSSFGDASSITSAWRWRPAWRKFARRLMQAFAIRAAVLTA
jgi:hypothetical protein